jgi:Tannase-like family of unknown function (DUF6351)
MSFPEVPMIVRSGSVRPTRPQRLLVATTVAALLLVGLPAAASADPGAEANSARLRVEVLSNRADLISGGDALVRVALAPHRDAREVRVAVGGHDETAAFVRQPDGSLLGLVTGLVNGRNVLTATMRHGRATVGARITVTNHPIGGPVFAGAQVQPWVCRTQGLPDIPLGAPDDAQCDTPTVYRFLYRSSDAAKPGFLPYDPAAPATDVATTTTDAGTRVPYIVRVEYGVIDRGVYAAAVLFDPARPWTPVTPQPAWNGRLVYAFGGGSAPHHVQDPPVSVLDDTALSRGYLVASSGLDVQGSNANSVVSAEALMMVKEHLIETYGQLRWTMGEGCSGGSIQQHLIAANYPGLLDGILPNCSYPDLWTTATEVADCGLLVHYFASTPGWTPAQQAAVAGEKTPEAPFWPPPPTVFRQPHPTTSVCTNWQLTFVNSSDPTLAANCELPAGDPRVYNPVTNPGGVRCDVQDYQQAIWGARDPADWTAVERSLGHGFARSPVDNVGIQYGLAALDAGTITPAQFLDLNARIGGFTIDGQAGPARSVASAGSLPIAYRTGQVSNGRYLGDVPIIDLRGSANVDDIHSDYHSWELRARLDAANGTHANQVIWTWPSFGYFNGITPPPDIALRAFLTMARWLDAITADHSDRPLARKVIAHKPAAAVDACWPDATLTAGGAEVIDPEYTGTCRHDFPHYGDARNVAGDPVTGQVLKCRLKPLDRSDYKAGFSAAQWAMLRSIYPSGVCDYRRPGVAQRPSLPWVTFTAGPGGEPLGPPPRSTMITGSVAG